MTIAEICQLLESFTDYEIETLDIDQIAQSLITLRL